MKFLMWLHRKLEKFLYDETFQELEDKYWRERIKAENLEAEVEILQYRLYERSRL